MLLLLQTFDILIQREKKFESRLLLAQCRDNSVNNPSSDKARQVQPADVSGERGSQ